MKRYLSTFLFFLSLGALLPAAPPENQPESDDTVVFRSDVSLVRVDVQVVDRSGRPITGLNAEDFVLTEAGKRLPVKNFAKEDMPLDVLFLFDVSTSMRPHVERIATAAHGALRVLGDDDRIAIMVFDRATRVRMPFRNSREGVQTEFDRMLRQESFSGGTDITRGMKDAARYVAKNARKDTRRAIVIVTDDETEFNRDDEGVSQALQRADAVLSALIAPDAMHSGGYPGGGHPRGGGYPGGGYPGGTRRGGGWGGITLPGQVPPIGGGGGGYPGGGGGHTQSAGTSEIAVRSGGDSFSVDYSSALETTLERLRQRYALHYHLPESAKSAPESDLNVELDPSVSRRYGGAEVKYRRVYLASNGTTQAGDWRTGRTTYYSRSQPEPAATASDTNNSDTGSASTTRKRRAVDGTGTSHGPNPNVGAPASSGSNPPQQ
jgi:VWFA-related protein